MYRWLWRHLPGGTLARVGQASVLLVLTLLLLGLVVFPWVEELLPSGDVTVDALLSTAPGWA